MTWDNKWSAVSALAAVAALIVPLLLFILSRDSKELTVETVSSAILVDLSDPGLSSLKLTYEDKSVSRLSVATIEVLNSGTRTIERADFEQPMVLRFQDPSDVLAVTVGEQIPQDLKPLIRSDVSGILVAPLLLNPGDRFRITAQLRGDFTEPVVEARISGVSSISRRVFRGSDPTRREFALIAGVLVTTTTYFYFAGLAVPVLLRRQSFIPVPIPDALVVTIVLGVGSATILVLGEKLLGLSNAQSMSVIAVIVLLSIVMMTFAIRRSLRLRAKLNAQGVTAERSTPV